MTQAQLDIKPTELTLIEYFSKLRQLKASSKTLDNSNREYVDTIEGIKQILEKDPKAAENQLFIGDLAMIYEFGTIQFQIKYPIHYAIALQDAKLINIFLRHGATLSQRVSLKGEEGKLNCLEMVERMSQHTEVDDTIKILCTPKVSSPDGASGPKSAQEGDPYITMFSNFGTIASGAKPIASLTEEDTNSLVNYLIETQTKLPNLDPRSIILFTILLERCLAADKSVPGCFDKEAVDQNIIRHLQGWIEISQQDDGQTKQSAQILSHVFGKLGETQLESTKMIADAFFSSDATECTDLSLGERSCRPSTPPPITGHSTKGIEGSRELTGLANEILGAMRKSEPSTPDSSSNPHDPSAKGGAAAAYTAEASRDQVQDIIALACSIEDLKEISPERAKRLYIQLLDIKGPPDSFSIEDLLRSYIALERYLKAQDSFEQQLNKEQVESINKILEEAANLQCNSIVQTLEQGSMYSQLNITLLDLAQKITKLETTQLKLLNYCLEPQTRADIPQLRELLSSGLQTNPITSLMRIKEILQRNPQVVNLEVLKVDYEAIYSALLPLHLAIYTGNIELQKLLFDNHAVDLDKVDMTGQTVWHALAASLANSHNSIGRLIEIAKYLQENAPPAHIFLADKNGIEPIKLLEMLGYSIDKCSECSSIPELLSKLQKSASQLTTAPPQISETAPKKESLKSKSWFDLIADFSDMVGTDRDQTLEEIKRRLAENPELISALIDENLEPVDSGNDEFHTSHPLHMAVLAGEVDLIKLLLNYLNKDGKELIFPKDDYNQTVWHALVGHAACYGLANLKEIFDLLVEHPNALAQLTDTDENDRSPIQLLKELSEKFDCDKELVTAAQQMLAEAATPASEELTAEALEGTEAAPNPEVGTILGLEPNTEADAGFAALEAAGGSAPIAVKPTETLQELEVDTLQIVGDEGPTQC